MDGNILCDDESCQRFEFGLWKKFSWNLIKERREHLSWKSPKGGMKFSHDFFLSPCSLEIRSSLAIEIRSPSAMEIRSLSSLYG